MDWLERFDARDQQRSERLNTEALEAAELHREIDLPNGQRLTIHAVPAGHPVRFGDGGGDWPDMFVIPLVWICAGLLHRFRFHGGWTVVVVRQRRIRWEQLVLKERWPTDRAAKSRVAELAEDLAAMGLTSGSRPPGRGGR